MLTAPANKYRLAHLRIANSVRRTDEKFLASMTALVGLFTKRDMDIDSPEELHWISTPRLDIVQSLWEISVFRKGKYSRETLPCKFRCLLY